MSLPHTNPAAAAAPPIKTISIELFNPLVFVTLAFAKPAKSKTNIESKMEITIAVKEFLVKKYGISGGTPPAKKDKPV